MDWMEQEQERNHNYVRCYNRPVERLSSQYHRYPGHVDFTVEVERCCACWMARSHACAKGGVEPQTETVWRQADSTMFRARLISINGYGWRRFHNVVAMMKEVGHQYRADQLPMVLKIVSAASSI